MFCVNKQPFHYYSPSARLGFFIIFQISMSPEFKSYTGTDGLTGIYRTAQILSKHICAEPLMANISPKGIFGYMKHNLATWLVDDKGAISGVVKVLPWHPNLANVGGGLEKMEEMAIENMDKGNSPSGFELGSLLIPINEYRKHHLATNLVEVITNQVHKMHPNKMIFSVVDKTNIASNNLFELHQKWTKLDNDLVKLFLGKMSIDILQGWDANIYLDPESMKILLQEQTIIA